MKSEGRVNESEIRIGNWFEHNSEWNANGYKGHFQWSASDWYGLGECVLSLDNVSPIILTPEILEKAGFIRYNEIEYAVASGVSEFHVFLEPVLAFIKYYPDGVHKDGYWMPVNSAYLHQLQNLYYSLTSQELTIKF